MVEFQPLWKNMRKSKWESSSPSFGVNIKKCLSCHHPDKIYKALNSFGPPKKVVWTCLNHPKKQQRFLHEIMPKKTGVEGKEVVEGKNTSFFLVIFFSTQRHMHQCLNSSHWWCHPILNKVILFGGYSIHPYYWGEGDDHPLPQRANKSRLSTWRITPLR